MISALKAHDAAFEILSRLTFVSFILMIVLSIATIIVGRRNDKTTWLVGMIGLGVSLALIGLFVLIITGINSWQF